MSARAVPAAPSASRTTPFPSVPQAALDKVRSQLDRVPRFPLGHYPTPLEPADRVSAALDGTRVWVKRDDCTGLAFGGNKTRHNEYVLADALDRGADLFVWGAGVQSNNCRQTAAACAKAGLDCHLVLGRGGKRPADAGPEPLQGNLLLDHLLGAGVEIVDEAIGEELDHRIEQVAERFRAAGRKPYLWDRERVKPLAALGYVPCLLEIVEQAADAGFVPDAVYVSSAGSTGSGLAWAAKAVGLACPVRSVCPIRWNWDTQADMARIANQAAERLGSDVRMSRDELDITHDHIGPGYGLASPDGLEALALFARREGLLLDPIYTAKAAAAVLADARAGRFRRGANVVLVHTGGTPALFAYSEVLGSGIAARTVPLAPRTAAPA